MNRFNNKKEEELFYLSRAMKACRLFPASEPVAHERPDFLIPCSGGRLGIEMTSYYRDTSQRGSPSRARCVAQREIKERAQELFERQCSVPLLVWLNWRPNLDARGLRKNREMIASGLAALVLRRYPRSESYRVDIIVGSEHGLDDSIGQYFARISARRLRPGQRAFWESNDAGFIQTTATELQVLIDDKDGKLRDYRGSCSAAWLVICAAGDIIASAVELDVDVVNHTYRSGFDKVLFYDNFQNRVYDLKVVPV